MGLFDAIISKMRDGAPPCSNIAKGTDKWCLRFGTTMCVFELGADTIDSEVQLPDLSAKRCGESTDYTADYCRFPSTVRFDASRSAKESSDKESSRNEF